MSETRLIGCGMVILATAAMVVAAGPGIRGDAAQPTLLDPVLTADCIMTSPRASLQRASKEDAREHAFATPGAAENSPRADGNIVIPVGARAVLSSPQSVEGPWDEGGHGAVKTPLTLPHRYADGFCEWDCSRRDLAEDGRPTWGACTATGSSEEVAPCPWITVGVASVERGMPVRFSGPSTNRLGCIAIAIVRSRPPRPLGPSRDTYARKADMATDLPTAASALDREVVHVTIHGTDRFVWWVGPHEEVAVSPRVTCARSVPNWMIRNTLSLGEDDLSGSGVCRRIGPGAFVCPPDRDAAIARAERSGSRNGSCWLFGGGFLGGFPAHLKTRLSSYKGRPCNG